MNIQKAEIKNFRNIEHIELEPSNGINVIFGENGHGKTNIIESIWLFTGCNSFRTRKNNELIKKDCKLSELETEIFSNGREQQARLIIDEKKEAYLNGIKQVSPRKFLGEFPAVVFSPSVLSVIKDGPSEKRKFIDIAISLIKPNYAPLLSKYNKTVVQRNSLLKQIGAEKKGEDLLFVFDEELARVGGKIINYRLEYLKQLEEIAPEIYSQISNGREKMKTVYLNSLRENGSNSVEQSEILYKNLSQNHERDIFRQMTSFGPHKDDLDIFLGDLNVRSYGSQGQQRSCALALKICEAMIMKEKIGEQPIALMDDVMSELDEKRQKFLMKFFEGWQVFVTCCDPSHKDKINAEKIFEIVDGRLKG